MIDERFWDAAVARGLVSADQAKTLKDFALERASESDLADDDEKLRFVGGFGDIFVVIGLLLFMGTAFYFMGRWPLPQSFPYFGSAAIAWLLAEFFARRRRMALPSIVLVGIFALACFCGLAVQLIGSLPWDALWLWPHQRMMIAVAAFLSVIALAIHYWRFRVPVTIAAIGIVLVGAALDLGAALFSGIAGWRNWLLLASGLALFALAMRFDLSDRIRRTRRADIAFWLHLAAAPLIVRALMGTFVEPGRGGLSADSALLVLGLFLALGVVAVIVDRRALLVSGLGYAGIAFASLIDGTTTTSDVLPVTLLILGAFVLLLSAGWRLLRAGVLKLLPRDIAARLPNPEPPSLPSSGS